ncbi:hypothetical protein JY651_37355 [Pyxidicoccus parkwayensis]|uniref:B box-type domain-containing protein n=1 Tax=Pyxidicoccus parkwayensis TaxID=2813578 RepID=A0ABX7NPZ4_9BACT|nr:hypothetical protein [Pyxidicoccus parkwaysis]QSQ20855.1 hypothetical protein JY651_37355 [Pyxidicoccus parkwaysis]
MTTSAPGGARCASHPDVAAVATCARCGGFLCGDCTEVVGESPYCEPCVGMSRREARPSRVVQAALGLNLLGIACLPCWLGLPLPTLVAGVAGFVLGLRELRRIHRGEGPERGRAQARVTLLLGVLNLVLFSVGSSSEWMPLLFGV